VRCPTCGTDNPQNNRFCPSCGAALSASPDAPASPQPYRWPRSVLSFLRVVHAERTGVAEAVVVLLVCMAASAIGWYPLGGLSRVVEMFVPAGGCVGIKEGTPAMFACAAVVGALTVVRSLLAVAVLAWFRVPIARWIGRVTDRLPDEAQFLVAPVLATAVFVIPWAGVHTGTGGVRGLLPQTQFPAVAGLFTFAAVRYGPRIQAALTAFFRLRDKYSPRARIIVAVLAALLVSLILNRHERNDAVREQVVVLVSLIAFCLALMPRTGELLPPLRLTATRGMRDA